MSRIRAVIALVASLVLVAAPALPAGAASPVWLTSNVSWTSPASGPPGTQVVDLDFAHHAHFDRVVIEVRGRLPGGLTHYQRRFAHDPSGLPVPIAGRSGLMVSLTSASGHDASGGNVYTGPMIARPRFQTLKALAITGDFEGVVTFAFALTHRAPYRIFTLQSPGRIVIDFRHAG